MSETPLLAILQVQTTDGGRDEHPILNPEVSFGRASDNDVVLDDQKVSGHHLKLTFTSGNITAMDLFRSF